MSAMSEVERINQERKGLLKKQIIAGMIEDSALQKALKKERHKLRDFAQQTKTKARKVEYRADIQATGPGISLGGVRTGVHGWRGQGGQKLKKEPLFKGGKKSALEYGPGTIRTSTGLFVSATRKKAREAHTELMKERQKWTTSGYRDYGSPLIPGQPEETGGTSELRRRARKRIAGKEKPLQYETPEERRQRERAGGLSYAPRVSETGQDLGLGLNTRAGGGILGGRYGG